jgi:H+/Na+-translocating ferredoxin:NAD+ oxidoreductase subunit D
MALLRVSSPHMTRRGNTGDVMLLVIMATLPGLAMLTWFFGWGNFINILWASLVAVACEALVLTLRRRPLQHYLTDYSAVLTAVLLGLSLPSLAPWWLTMIATGFAIIVAKHLYGGMGQNPFNPAMIGYALVLIAFPLEMTSWLAPQTLSITPGQTMGFIDTLFAIFPFLSEIALSVSTEAFDAVTMATPLDAFKHKGALTAEEFWATELVVSTESWKAWQLVSIGFLAGGAYLIYRRVFTWHIPVSMLSAIAVMSLIFWSTDPSNYAYPELHLLGGATMLGAFFIATDPVTAATSIKGKLYYGAGIGILIYLIRNWGNYPDAVAFAVLLMNFVAPLIDHYTQPRTYGHKSTK